MLSVDDLFKSVNLIKCGPVKWETPILERGSGIYVITLLDPTAVPVDLLSDIEKRRWNSGQEIVYIGKAKSLHRRIHQFYRHKLGARSPHRGGQDIKLLNTQLLVYWSLVTDYAEAERKLIEAFETSIGALPFANRVRGGRTRSIDRGVEGRKNSSSDNSLISASD